VAGFRLEGKSFNPERFGVELAGLPGVGKFLRFAPQSSKPQKQPIKHPVILP